MSSRAASPVSTPGEEQAWHPARASLTSCLQPPAGTDAGGGWGPGGEGSHAFTAAGESEQLDARHCSPAPQLRLRPGLGGQPPHLRPPTRAQTPSVAKPAARLLEAAGVTGTGLPTTQRKAASRTQDAGRCPREPSQRPGAESAPPRTSVRLGIRTGEALRLRDRRLQGAILPVGAGGPCLPGNL